MRIFAFHLLNDFSGSPKVLRQLLLGWAGHGIEVHLITTTDRDGFLSDLEGVVYHPFWYSFAENKVLRLLFLFASQTMLFFKTLFLVRKDDIVYVNTVLPFGAGLAGKLRGCRVIYHVHETSIKPAILKKFLFGIARMAASEAIFVSGFLAKEETGFRKSHILYNALPGDFNTNRNPGVRSTPEGNVLMVCSLKWYKGVDEFLRLATENPHMHFRLVVNADNSDIAAYFSGSRMTQNLEIFPVQKDVRPFYEWADVVLNLSRPDGWVETFGLTAIEAMSYGLPVIVPPVGGIAELVEDGVNGFKADSRDMVNVGRILGDILGSQDLYNHLSKGALDRAGDFSEGKFLKGSLDILRF